MFRAEIFAPITLQSVYVKRREQAPAIPMNIYYLLFIQYSLLSKQTAGLVCYGKLTGDETSSPTVLPLDLCKIIGTAQRSSRTVYQWIYTDFAGDCESSYSLAVTFHNKYRQRYALSRDKRYRVRYKNIFR